MKTYYVVSDIHGDYKQFIYHLQRYNIINNSFSWIARNSKLFVLGDSTDRGYYGYEVLKLIKDLQEEAFLVGGEVKYILGNHDALILSQVYGVKDLFGVQAYNTQMMFKNVGGRDRDVNRLIEDPHLLKWLEESDFIFKEGETLFQHCDSTIYYSIFKPEQLLFIDHSNLCQEINTALHFYVSRFSNKSDAYFHLFDLLCSYKGFLQEEIVDQYLERFNVSRVIHGHNITPSRRIERHFGGKVIAIDCEMPYNKYNSSPARGDIIVITEEEINEVL